MALTKCPECGHHIDEDAKVCPNCGHQVDLSDGQAEQVTSTPSPSGSAVRAKPKSSWTFLDTFLLLILILLHVAAAYFIYLNFFKWPYDSAVKYYGDEKAAYEQQISEYGGIANLIAQQNEDLNASIEELQSVLDSGEEPSDPQTRENAIAAIQQAEENRVPVPVVEPGAAPAAPTESVMHAKEISQAARQIDQQRFALYNQYATLSVPDYSSLKTVLTRAKEALQDSIQLRKEADQISAEMKSFLDSYEATINDYYVLARSYDPADTAAVARAADLKAKIAEMGLQLDTMRNNRLSVTDMEYYNTVTVRCASRLGDANAMIEAAKQP